jgi:UDP-N-acetylglucosamine:LPS N-acetylglucosamine transferase
MIEPPALPVRQRSAARATPARAAAWAEARPLARAPLALVRADRPRILLLTSGLGSGHLRAAQAIREAVLERAPAASVRTLDFWSLMDESVARAIQQAYLHLVAERPELYDRIYRLDQRTWRRVLAQGALPAPVMELFHLVPAELWRADGLKTAGEEYPADRLWLRAMHAAFRRGPGGRLWRGGMRRALLAWARLRVTARLATRWREFEPDVVIATQMHPAALASLAMRAHGLRAPAIGVLTDFGVHDFWVHPGIGHYCVATEAMASALGDAGVEKSAVTVSGIPLMPGFRDPPPAAEARRALGLDPLRPAILVSGGGLGVGLQGAVARLAAHRSGWQILVAAGRNAEARKTLQALPARGGRLRVLPWTEHMERALRAADIVVGKPGGLTLAEVLACGRPLLATRSLLGQEGYNVRFLEENRVGRLVAEDELPAAAQALLADAGELASIQQRAWSLGRREGAARVAALACELAARNAAAVEAAH